MSLQAPFLLLLGDAVEAGYIKTALGLAEWRPEDCLGQLRFNEQTISAGLTDMSLSEAKAAGVKTVVIGVAPAGGRLPESWIPFLEEALTLGLNIGSGLHDKLKNYPSLVNLAEKNQCQLTDLRSVSVDFATGTGNKRSGKRLITVGTDCAVGKKYTALSIFKAMQSHGFDADFRATGQTGIMLSGSGLPIDATIADFTSGAAEYLSPANHVDHWDVIEGQGAFFHPAYAGVCVSLIHGSQPDAMVLCHDPSRKTLLGHDDFKMPSVPHCINAYEMVAQLTNPNARVIAISLNSKEMTRRQFLATQKNITDLTGLTCFDPIRDSADLVVELLN